MLQRVTISLDETLGRDFDALIAAQGYSSRSEAVRDLVRLAIEARRLDEAGDAPSVASLSYVYDHHTRSLAQRLTEIGHEHYELVVSTSHIHLDHDSCLYVVRSFGTAGSRI
ncbi:MAG: nickel-responsive transcriptional regulator NikR [bacterium]|nr:nickel-responsive transcriptional regulator NikR [bacterium]